jgi:colicin import membrane protein
VHAQINNNITELLNGAKAAIEAGEKFMHIAADSIAKASEQGATQREIAAGVGKSAAWVNGLLKWRTAGYPETPFGPQAKATRDKTDRVQSTKHENPKNAKHENPKAASSEQQAKADKAKAEAATAKAQADEAKARAAEARAKAAEAKTAAKAKATADRLKDRADARKAKAQAKAKHDSRFDHLFGKKTAQINAAQRDTLMKCLGLLGSEHAGEVANAAAMAEKVRKKLNASWDDLIVDAVS